MDVEAPCYPLIFSVPSCLWTFLNLVVSRHFPCRSPVFPLRCPRDFLLGYSDPCICTRFPFSCSGILSYHIEFLSKSITYCHSFTFKTGTFNNALIQWPPDINVDPRPHTHTHYTCIYTRTRVVIIGYGTRVGTVG